MTPETFSLFLKAVSSLPQLSSRRALSRESTASPSAFSTRSRYTSTVSPILRLAGRPDQPNGRDEFSGQPYILAAAEQEGSQKLRNKSLCGLHPGSGSLNGSK